MINYAGGYICAWFCEYSFTDSVITSIALDIYARNLYAAIPSKGMIQELLLNGSRGSTIAGPSYKPTSIAVDGKNRYVPIIQLLPNHVLLSLLKNMKTKFWFTIE